MKDDFKIEGEFFKHDEELGLVFGWACVCTEDGKPYFDKQDDHIPEGAMLEAAAEFMENSRVHKEMHAGGTRGTVVFMFPLTTELKKHFKIECARTGLMVAAKPDEEMLKKYKSGKLKGFSLGGKRVKDEKVEV